MVPKISIITSVYKGEDYFRSFFKSLKEQTVFSISELILISNDPSISEKKIIEKFKYENPEKVKTIYVSPKETLSSSWNKGIQLAKGDFLAFWNVDDIRTPNSLENQIKTLKNYPDSVMTYGDFIEIQVINEISGVQFISPEFEKKVFTKRFASGGAFLVFRSDIFKKFGYFDEQLEIVSDYDLVLRLVNLGCSFRKTPGIMGYFLNNQTGLSNKKNHNKLFIEQNIVHRRYGNLDKLRWNYLKSDEIQIYSQYFFFNTPISISDYGFSVGDLKFISINQRILFLLKNITSYLMLKFRIWDFFLRKRDLILNRKKYIKRN